jgi:inosine/xanthosine triphosphate pyrophosphatase family protein
MDFYERIKSYVKDKGVTIDVYLQTLFNGEKDKEAFYGWKKRKILPRANDALIIARDMGIAIEELIGEPSPLGLDFDERELVESYRLFDDDDRHKVKALMSAKRAKYAKKTAFK